MKRRYMIKHFNLVLVTVPSAQIHRPAEGQIVLWSTGHCAYALCFQIPIYG